MPVQVDFLLVKHKTINTNPDYTSGIESIKVYIHWFRISWWWSGCKCLCICVLEMVERSWECDLLLFFPSFFYSLLPPSIFSPFLPSFLHFFHPSSIYLSPVLVVEDDGTVLNLRNSLASQYTEEKQKIGHIKYDNLWENKGGIQTVTWVEVFSQKPFGRWWLLSWDLKDELELTRKKAYSKTPYICVSISYFFFSFWLNFTQCHPIEYSARWSGENLNLGAW